MRFVGGFGPDRGACGPGRMGAGWEGAYRRCGCGRCCERIDASATCRGLPIVSGSGLCWPGLGRLLQRAPSGCLLQRSGAGCLFVSGPDCSRALSRVLRSAIRTVPPLSTVVIGREPRSQPFLEGGPSASRRRAFYFVFLIPSQHGDHHQSRCEPLHVG
jgi:hypothetical protein